MDLPPIIIDEVEYYVYSPIVNIVYQNLRGDIDRPMIHGYIKTLLKNVPNSSRISTYLSNMNAVVKCKTSTINLKNVNTCNTNRIDISQFGILLEPISNYLRKIEDNQSYNTLDLYDTIIVDQNGQFNFGDNVVLDVPMKIPLKYFKYKERVVSMDNIKLKFGIPEDKDFISISYIMCCYGIGYNKGIHTPRITLLCNIYEEKWDNIYPRRVCNDPTKLIEDYIRDENDIKFVTSELDEVRNISCGIPERRNDICHICKNILCDDIYVLELEFSHWCFCSTCMTHNLYYKFSSMFDCELLRVTYPVTIEQAIDTLDVPDNVKDMFIAFSHAESINIPQYKCVNADSCVYNYLMRYMELHFKYYFLKLNHI
jgi:hypothetical protein